MTDTAFELGLGLAVIVAVVLALMVTVWVGKRLVKGIFIDAPPMPAWLEAVAPVKGRWLRILLGAPAVAAFLTIFFVVVLYIVGVLTTFFAYGLMALYVEWRG